MNTEKNSTIAKRYAQSLFDSVKKTKKATKETLEGLKNVEVILKDSKDLYSAMSNPIISGKDKTEIIDAIFEKDASETIRNLLKLLVEKNRFNLIYSIIHNFSFIVDEHEKIARVGITCAIELTKERKKEIKEKLDEKLNKKVDIKYDVDKSIIAGLVLKIGDDILDTSVAHKLEELKKEITK